MALEEIEDAGPGIQGYWRKRLKRQGLVEADQRFVVPTKVAQDRAAIAERGHRFRRHRQRALDRFERFGEPAEILQRRAAIVQRLGIPGLQSQRAVKARQCFLEALALLQGNAAMVEHVRTGRLQPQQLVERRDGLVRLAFAELNHAEQMQPGDVRRLAFQRGAALGFGQFELALPVVRHGELKAGTGIHDQIPKRIAPAMLARVG